MLENEHLQRGLELQGYMKSIEGLTLKEIAKRYLKKHHLPQFLANTLVYFAYPLLVAKDYQIYKANEG